MSRNEIKKMVEREQLLDILIKKYGMESEPVIYFSTWAWKDIYNMEKFFNTAINWKFNWGF